ncbi:MAG: hypothetical protein IPP60_17690 [Sphingobacteriales bacterium]|jgi:hypothetical protein|nr:hypothetical protein [Sphingobacteriales bacterium]
MNLRFNFNTGKFHPDDIKQAKEELTKKLDKQLLDELNIELNKYPSENKIKVDIYKDFIKNKP